MSLSDEEVEALFKWTEKVKPHGVVSALAESTVWLCYFVGITLGFMIWYIFEPLSDVAFTMLAFGEMIWCYWVASAIRIFEHTSKKKGAEEYITSVIREAFPDILNRTERNE